VNPFDLPGPQFLLFYIILAGVVIFGLVFWRRRAELSAEAPKLDLSDPYLIAYLRGGEAEVLRVATVSLIDRGLLVRNGRQIQRAENASPDSVRRPVEQALLKKYARGGEVSWMFEDDGLSTACEAYGATLKQARLLPDEYVNQARLVRLVIACFILSGVGFTKVLIALDAGRTNVGFLIILTIAAIVVAAAVSFPRLTESGKAMIEDVQSLYSGLRDRALFLNPGGAGIEAMMLAAVFGVGALAGPAFSYAGDLFPRAKRSQSNACGTNSGCGSSSCSSGSSCGSSCGGGCGGGCGGCGG
jgi:uncharacterized protein (TIGR04222 family)